MCGVAAIYAFASQAPPVDAGELAAVTHAMATRGPDGAGTWTSADGRVGLGHRRLAILDLSDAGAQPMHGAQGCVVSYNGEIYNHAELRAELAAQGHVFRSHCDTEVLLALYEREGPGFLDRLRGMYALAIWDPRRRGLLLARDPLGIKPLYYAEAGGCLRAASQVRALQASALQLSRDPAGRVGFLLWGYVPEPVTLWREIRSLPAGTWLWADAEGVGRPKAHFDLTQTLREAEAGPPPTAGSRTEAVAEALRDSVAAHLVSDVPVGLFLSAGLDSTCLAALAQRAGGRLQTFTLGYAEGADEVADAAAVASHLGLPHAAARLGAAEFQAALPALLAAMDQPSIDGANTFFVAREAARRGLKVALSGVGGDELFGSYPSFRQIPAARRRLGPLARLGGLGTLLRRLSAPLLRRSTSPKYASLLEYGGSLGGLYQLRRGLFLPWELRGLVPDEELEAGLARLATHERLAAQTGTLRDGYLGVMSLEMGCYLRNQLLRDADWAGMAHGLEIRTPLVDAELLRRLAPLLAHAGRPAKRVLAEIAGPALPAWLAARPKRGFALPIRDWLQAGAEAPPAPAHLARGLRGWALQLDGAFR